MRIAAIYDIHGNLPALEAVLAEIASADVERIIVGGDVIPGPMPRATLVRLLNLAVPVEFLQGNGESDVLLSVAGDGLAHLPMQARNIVRWCGEQLDPDLLHTIAGWPLNLKLHIDPIGDILFCHATPRNNTEIFTRLTPIDRVLPAFKHVEEPLVVCGHTHMQFDRTIGTTRVVNSGSVGMPFGEPGAYWILLGPDVQFRQTNYDLGDAARQIQATGYPNAGKFAAENVLRAPSESEMLERFAAVELGEAG